jgi:hypothetical protein
LTNRTLKTVNGQLNRNTKFDVFKHLKRNGGSNFFSRRGRTKMDLV